MPVRAFRREDAPALAALSADGQRGESDFVLNPLWEDVSELFAEFERFAIAPEDHVRVAEAGDGVVVGLSGFLRRPGSTLGGLLGPVVASPERGRGFGGELLRDALRHGGERLGLELAVAGIGTRNRAGYSLLASQGFRPVRQHFLMRCDEPPAEPRRPARGLEFAPAGPSDAEAVHAVYQACDFEARSREDMARVMEDGWHAHALARRGGRVVGFVELDVHWTRRVWVAFVGVLPELRDKGVGSALTAWALRKRFEKGASSALLLLSPANRTAFRAYEKVGFRRHRTFDVLERSLP